MRKLDVAALGNILTYLFLNDKQRDEINHARITDRGDMARKYFGFDENNTSVSRNIFDKLNCKEDLRLVAGVKKLQEHQRKGLIYIRL